MNGPHGARMSREAESYLRDGVLSKNLSKQASSVSCVVFFKRTTYDVMDDKSFVNLSIERTRVNGKLVVLYEIRYYLKISPISIISKIPTPFLIIIFQLSMLVSLLIPSPVKEVLYAESTLRLEVVAQCSHTE